MRYHLWKRGASAGCILLHLLVFKQFDRSHLAAQKYNNEKYEVDFRHL